MTKAVVFLLVGFGSLAIILAMQPKEVVIISAVEAPIKVKPVNQWIDDPIYPVSNHDYCDHNFVMDAIFKVMEWSGNPAVHAALCKEIRAERAARGSMS